MSHNITLSELNKRIKETVQEKFYERYYVVAEISELNESRSHAYLELIEKNDSKIVLAKARATIWARTYRMLKPYFESSTGHKFEAGLKVLLVVSVEFHEVYGFSLNIKDIDPNYTIGDIERKRLLIIQRLEKEGVIDMNKELLIPAVPQKIAIISSETAAGYGDFIDQLQNNDYGFKFLTKLFPAAMQGEDTESSIINALEKIFECEDEFDIVVIIRGGGSKSDLSWFDSYQLALNISQFPLPVISGIGHEKDETIVDLVVNISLKTPTAVAGFLIDSVAEFYNYLNHLSEEFVQRVNNIIHENKNYIEHLVLNFKPVITEIINAETNKLELKKVFLKNSINIITQKQYFLLNEYHQEIKNSVKSSFIIRKQNIEFHNIKLKNKTDKYLVANKYKIDVLEQKNKLLNPENILERGYSITLHKNKLLKSTQALKKGDLIETKIIDGSFKSKVEN